MFQAVGFSIGFLMHRFATKMVSATSEEEIVNDHYVQDLESQLSGPW
jgi:hypothetical protein